LGQRLLLKVPSNLGRREYYAIILVIIPIAPNKNNTWF
jgi:hypothetical protein